MFGKLLKYDFRSVLKQFAILWPAALVLAVVNRFMLSGDMDNVSKARDITIVVTMLIFVAILIAMFTVTVLFIIQRFYKGLLGDEGYLMHTLPVKPTALIGSKLLSGMTVTVVSILVAIFSMFLLIPVEIEDVFGEIRYGWREFLSMTGANPGLLITEIIVYMLVGIASGLLLVYLAMCIGQLFNSHRVAMSFVAYLAISVVLSVISSMLPFIGFDFELSVSPDSPVSSYVTWSGFHQRVWFQIIWEAVCGIAAYVGSEFILRKKLNLE